MIGVLGLQGDFAAHGAALSRLGAVWRVVKRAEHLDGLAGLVVPGGESTTMIRLLDSSSLWEPVRAFAGSRGFLLGTCAGMILAAREVRSPAQRSLGLIDITVERSGLDYKIHFRDSGPGFPDAIKQRIFEPFNSSKETKGAGLGLYISYHIVKKHGGSMCLDETAQSGAQMVITLPRRGGMENA